MIVSGTLLGIHCSLTRRSLGKVRGRGGCRLFVADWFTFVLTSAVINVRQTPAGGTRRHPAQRLGPAATVGLTSAVLPHFVEINVGIGHRRHQYYFWLMLP